jgi:pantoate--beta-alanine ligase
MPSPRIVRTVKALRLAVRTWRSAGESVALVPTMGALHEGHLTLVTLARRKADRTVVSIFVNPTQFGPAEDLARYPRDEAGDAKLLGMAGADLIWAPDAEEMYPHGHATAVVPKGAALPLEGEFRPHHFAGVATVCTKLFSQATPDVAIFGEKDFQQLCVIRQLVADLNLPVKIVAAPTSRERDGLARSSRNAYLTPDERSIAPALHRALKGLAAIAANGGLINKAIDVATHDLLHAGFAKVDYLTVRDAATLEAFDGKSGRPGRVLGAAWLGATRLIDNVAV